MMSAWPSTDALRHPWLAGSPLKRKHSGSSSDGEVDFNNQHVHALQVSGADSQQSDDYPRGRSPGISDELDHNQTKRRRCDTIERKMQQLRIQPGALAYGLQLDGIIQRPSSTMLSMDNLENGGLVPGAPLVTSPPLPLSQVNSTSSHDSYSTNRTYAYTAGSLSPVSRNAILDAYAVEEPVSPEFDRNVGLAQPSSYMYNYNHGQIQPQNIKINEPASSASDVRMKGAEPAWYEREKDRIVITDLDEAAEEGEEAPGSAPEDEYKSEAEPHPNSADYADCNADYSISSVLLAHIKRQANFPFQSTLIQPPEKERGDPGDRSRGERENESSEEKQKVEAGQDDVRIEEIDDDAANLLAPLGGFQIGTVTEQVEPMDVDMDVDI